MNRAENILPEYIPVEDIPSIIIDSDIQFADNKQINRQLANFLRNLSARIVPSHADGSNDVPKTLKFVAVFSQNLVAFCLERVVHVRLSRNELVQPGVPAVLVRFAHVQQDNQIAALVKNHLYRLVHNLAARPLVPRNAHHHHASDLKPIAAPNSCSFPAIPALATTYLVIHQVHPPHIYLRLPLVARHTRNRLENLRFGR
ncbi:hypothetical protein AYI70_g9777 [Smittium culicis]|uniref:Uncharacterized protein n=1 Tax=Smittium culicis TaxID=133412 RepID=A0A1R1X9Q2_9FUNG|nr:hypothetical protein AYI70_g9777 [Smittium culicis]